ncbi:MAG TPA: DUF2182 domain-containing protein [Gemmatirosa sp.]
MRTGPHTGLLRRASAAPELTAVVLLAGGAGAWLLMARQARMMDDASSMRPASVAAFLVMWAVMMSAMMLPSLAPLTTRYVRAIGRPVWRGASALVVGYLAVWTALGLAGYALAAELGRTAASRPGAARWSAVALYAVCGAYQLTPLKRLCLRECRAPIGLLLRYAGWRGPMRHVRVGLHHGAMCVGCCWALMLLLFTAGLMNLGAMLLLALIVAVEKLGSWGATFSRWVGIASLVLAAAAIWRPALAPGIMPMHGPAMPHAQHPSMRDP